MKDNISISIFGLGYVGCVGMGCLAQNGYNVIGVDISDTKVDLLNSGKPTIIEKDIGDGVLAQFGKVDTKVLLSLEAHKAVGHSKEHTFGWMVKERKKQHVRMYAHCNVHTFDRHINNSVIASIHPSINSPAPSPEAGSQPHPPR